MTTPEATTSYEKLIRHIYDAAEAHDVDAVLAMYADDLQVSAPGGQISGKDQFGGFLRAWLEAFPDIKWTITHTLANGDTGVSEIIARATHTGTLRMPDGEVPATGATFVNRFCEVHRLRNGVIAETRSYWDSLSMLQQLGIAPGSNEK